MASRSDERGLAYCPAMPAELHHRHRRAVGEHDRHLQQHPHLAGDVGLRAGRERLGAVAALQQERLAAGHRGQPLAQLVDLGRDDQRRQRGQGQRHLAQRARRRARPAAARPAATRHASSPRSVRIAAARSTASSGDHRSQPSCAAPAQPRRGSAEEDLGLGVQLGRDRLELGRWRRPAAPGRCRCRAARPSCPSRRRATASMACRPNRVASTRSNADGVPPRWMCPSTVVRASLPVRFSICAGQPLADAAEAGVPERVEALVDASRSRRRRASRPRPRRGSARSATGTGSRRRRRPARARTAARGSG